MGALEYEPVEGPDADEDHRLDVSTLVNLASEALADREKFVTNFDEGSRRQAMRDILRVGASAGGARAEALIAYNPKTGEVRSGQLSLGPGFEHWLIKLDRVEENRDREALADPQGCGTIEYAYRLMARDLSIEITECRLLAEGGRQQIPADGLQRGGSQPGRPHQEHQLHHESRRPVCALAADDVTHAYAPSGDWTSRHQMSVNGKRDDFTVEDFTAAEKTARLSRGRAQTILRETIDVVSRWPTYAEIANVPENLATRRSQGLGRHCWIIDRSQR